MGEAWMDRLEEKGYARAIKNIIEKALKKGKTPQEISDFNDVPLQEVLDVQKEMLESVDNK